MKIAFFMSEYPSAGKVNSKGGLASYTANLSEALKSTGHESRVITRADLKCERPLRRLRSALEKRVFPEVNFERSVSAGLRSEITRMVSEKRIDIIQVPEYNGGASELKGINCPLVVRFHTPSFLVDRLNGVASTFRRKRWYALEGEGIAAANALTSSSEGLKREVCRFYGVDENRVTVIRNPVDTVTFTPMHKEHSRFRILFCGRLEERKGMSIIEKALPEILKKTADSEILFAGGDTGRNGLPYKELLSEIAGKERERLLFKGYVERAELPALYNSADVFIIPSLFDNSPNSLFEAMACGLPCIGSRVGGIDEIISDGSNGLLFNTERTDELTDRICELYNNYQLRQTLGISARNHMEESYSMKYAAEAHISFYKKVCKGEL
ncbi:MAG: glycosyltransferase family 4 protein [Fibrobacteres bacterium]|nr:glycosyltransferase family 4 protein [Fibrobacterota bacterium]